MTVLVTLLFSAIAGCDSGPSLDDVRALQAQARFQESLEPLRALIETNPDDPEINFRYGAALNRTTSSPVAVWSLRKAAEDPDWAARAYMELAASNARTGNFEGAIENAGKVLESEPDHIGALNLRGSAYLNDSGDLEKVDLAREDFERILDINPQDATAKASLAATHLLLGEVEDAEQLLEEIDLFAEEIEASDATKAMLCSTRAMLQAEKGEIEGAEEKVEQCLANFPGDALVTEQAIAFYDATGRNQRSEEILSSALTASPGNVAFRDALASRALARGEREEAESILRDATTLSDPRTQSWAWVRLTNFYLAHDELDSAIESYQKVMNMTPDPTQISILTMADLFARAERHEEALEVAQKLKRDAYRGLIEARVHLNERRPAEALKRLEEVFPSWPNNPGARYYAARAAEQLGDFERAVEEYRQSIRSDIEQTESGLRLAKMYRAAGSTQNAWNTAAQYFRIHREDPDAIRVLLQVASAADEESVKQLFTQLEGGPLWPTALSIRAQLLEEREGISEALSMLDDAEAIDFTRPANAELLRTRTRLLLAVEKTTEAAATVSAALDAQPEFGPFHEIQGLVLAQQKAPLAQIRAAHARAVELAPRSAVALLSLGHAEQASGQLDAALDLYRRAIDADLSNIEPGRALARALSDAGRRQEAQAAWEDHLREHPWDSEAASALCQLRIAAGQLDQRTLELAERAVLFMGGDPAQRQLIALHESRGESERAQALAEAVEKGRPLPPTQITTVDGI